jgi:hypothetical protein
MSDNTYIDITTVGELIIALQKMDVNDFVFIKDISTAKAYEIKSVQKADEDEITINCLEL